MIFHDFPKKSLTRWETSARENEAGDMCDRAMRLAAYPEQCGYKSETGGRLKERRRSFFGKPKVGLFYVVSCDNPSLLDRQNK